MKQPPYITSENSLTIFWDGKPYTLRKENVNFELAKKALLEARYDDLGDLLDIKKSIENFVQGDIEVKDEVVYYKGHRLHGVVVDKLLDMLRSGMKDSTPITNFITRLQANPSANSVAELYTFLGYKSLPTTPEGKVLGYKGVQSDYWSATGNADTIVVQGKTNERHQILNEVGATIEVARRCVDDNKDNHCSFGLHVGSFDYASGWSGEDGKLLLVEFDPADAVSVPTDCNFQKLRVSKYNVISDITDQKKELDKPVYEANKPIYGSDSDDYVDDEDDDYEDDYDYVDEEDDYEDEDEDHTDRIESHYEANPKDLLANNPHLLDRDDPLADAYHTYICHRLDLGQNVTLKHLADIKVSRDRNLTCSQIKDILDTMKDYDVSVDENKPLYLYEVNYV